METIKFTAAQFEEFMNFVDNHFKDLEKKGAVPQRSFIDNKTFLEMMGVSQRTGQAWRDEGKIAFSQVGNKIYYKMVDIEKFLEEHHNRSFAK